MIHRYDIGMEGMLCIDKPLGWTSHDVVAVVRKKLGVAKVGHAGTLDPLATGLLLVLVGKKYTRQQATFLKQDKTYLVMAQLGVTTDAFDTDGVETSRAAVADVQRVTQEQVIQALQKMQLQTEQRVPAFSAIKRQGKKLYELARKGEIVVDELPMRPMVIYSLELTDFSKTTESVFFSVQISCSSGTYVRSIIHDLGQALGVGAVVMALRRMAIGTYTVAGAVSPNDPALATFLQSI